MLQQVNQCYSPNSGDILALPTTTQVSYHTQLLADSSEGGNGSV
jgi:hypothetical protein